MYVCRHFNGTRQKLVALKLNYFLIYCGFTDVAIFFMKFYLFKCMSKNIAFHMCICTYVCKMHKYICMLCTYICMYVFPKCNNCMQARIYTYLHTHVHKYTFLEDIFWTSNVDFIFIHMYIDST